MKNLIFLAIVPLMAAGCNQNRPPVSTPAKAIYNYSHKLRIADKILAVEIADTPEQMRLGLSNRSAMQEGQGMLFDFEKGSSVSPSFWMKNMEFDLDLIWIKNNPSTGSGQIVGITADVPYPRYPADPLPMYNPPAPVDMVLEVNAGWSGRNNIKVGDIVQFVN